MVSSSQVLHLLCYIQFPGLGGDLIVWGGGKKLPFHEKCTTTISVASKLYLLSSCMCGNVVCCCFSFLFFFSFFLDIIQKGNTI